MRGPRKSRTAHARTLRQTENEAEERLWFHLRNRRLNGHKFVRQHAIGPYFADFACRSLWLVIKLDGSQHVASAHDLRRDHFMAAAGWSIARFWSSDMLADEAAVTDTIVAICEGRLVEATDAWDFRFIPAVK